MNILEGEEHISEEKCFIKVILNTNASQRLDGDGTHLLLSLQAFYQQSEEFKILVG